MKRFVLVLLCLTLVSFAVSADGGQSVTVKNSTGYDVYYLYISPSDWDNWEDDLLMGDYLTDGQVKTFILDPEYGDACSFDVKAVDLDDDSYTIYEVDLCAGGVVEVTMDHYDEDNYDDGYGYDGGAGGYEEGYSTGYRDAYSDAYRQGYSDGFSDGRNMD